ncbi:hypothetical protein Glove_121g32 [Diversispora epigaea]|uniref:Uncharacterized protein n=1 Tax=Diversispora epigaea TaxID=1348612 RepID=A0A397J3P8_9GLOM|nr:hypothetical protein Glove_121g32 [Diversispora epigaea]
MTDISSTSARNTDFDLCSLSRLLPESFDTEGEGRQRAREVLQRSPEGRQESRRQHSQEGWREGRQRSGEEEGNTTGGDTERAEIVGNNRNASYNAIQFLYYLIFFIITLL